MSAARLSWTIALLVVASSSPALAQERAGFASNRFEPAEHGSRFFVVDTLDLRGQLRPSTGAVLEWAHLPVAAYAADDTRRRALVEHALTMHVGGSLAIAERLRVAIDIPLAIHQDGEGVRLAGESFRAATKPALGDVRGAVDVRVLGRHGGPLVLALGARVWAPTGVPSQHTGDGAARVAPQVLASGEAGAFVWATRVAAVQRWRDDRYAGSDLGAELSGALGAGLRIRRFLVGPEVFASTGISTARAFFGERSTPIEALAGVHHDAAGGLRWGAFAGAGFGRGLGSPAVRLGLSLEWAPEIERPDRDKDGIEDRVDACPDTAGVADPDPDLNGCPVEEPMPMPREDSDGDGVLDVDDACPAVAGVRTADRMTNGCPPQPERPLAVMTETEIRIEQEVRFETDSAALLADSEPVLEEIRRVLVEHPEIRKVRVEGHTDATGDDAHNDELSSKRAAAVVAWLVAHGVEASRLVSAGLGSREPIDSNATEEGRAKNRRVVLRILERRAPR